LTEDIQRCFDLSRCDGLQSLHLNDEDTFDYGMSEGHIPVLLSKIISLRIEELFINISDASAIKPEVWTKIDLQLDQPQFSNLQQLNFSLNAVRRAKDIGFVKDRLPLCATRGILRFR
jgi:hypothetical protein